MEKRLLFNGNGQGRKLAPYVDSLEIYSSELALNFSNELQTEFNNEYGKEIFIVNTLTGYEDSDIKYRFSRILVNRNEFGVVFPLLKKAFIFSNYGIPPEVACDSILRKRGYEVQRSGHREAFYLVEELEQQERNI
jgi:hypothetical protein